MSHPKPCRFVPGYGHFLRSHVPFCKDRACEGCQPCTHDENGSPIRHCEAKKSCGRHLDHAHPHTCPKCIGHVRADLQAIRRMSLVLIPLAAEHGYDRGRSGGVNHQATALAGPAADPLAWTSHRQAQIRAVQGHGTESTLLTTKLLDPEDRNHPKAVLGRWEAMIREHFKQRPARLITADTAAEYLAANLTRLAQDPAEDWALFASELRICRAHLEDILNTARRPVTGAPCPSCSTAPPLTKVYAHWCTRETCEKEHDTSGAGDVWRCPNCAAKWTEAEYRLWVTDDYLSNADHLTATDIQMVYGIPASTIRTWAQRGQVAKRGRNASGQRLYDVHQALAAYARTTKNQETA